MFGTGGIIRSNDFISDPCLQLRRFKEYLNTDKWNYSTILELDKLIPRVRAEPTKHHSSKLVLEKPVPGFPNILITDILIGDGSYGQVRLGYDGGKQYFAVKTLHNEEFDLLDFFSEMVLQSELFCGMRGQWGQGARIPKIHFTLWQTNPPPSFTNHLVGMESLNGTLFEAFGRDAGVGGDLLKVALSAVMQIAELLKTLQRRYNFMHRDLHTSNIMYKLVGGKVRWYIIDFGFARMDLNGETINKSNWKYDDHEFNPSHDLRLLLMAIGDTVFSLTSKMKNHPKSLFGYLQNHMRRVEGQLENHDFTQKRAYWWNFYDQFVHIQDNAFLPEKIIDDMKKITRLE